MTHIERLTHGISSYHSYLSSQPQSIVPSNWLKLKTKFYTRLFTIILTWRPFRKGLEVQSINQLSHSHHVGSPVTDCLMLAESRSSLYSYFFPTYSIVTHYLLNRLALNVQSVTLVSQGLREPKGYQMVLLYFLS